MPYETTCDEVTVEPGGSRRHVDVGSVCVSGIDIAGASVGGRTEGSGIASAFRYASQTKLILPLVWLDRGNASLRHVAAR